MRYMDNSKKSYAFKTVSKIISFFVLLVLLLEFICNGLTATKLADYPSRNEFFQMVNAEENNTIDIVFIGDSTVMKSIVPMQIWNEVQVTSILMSYSVMQPSEGYFDLEKVFNTQKPKYVFVDTSFLVQEKDMQYSKFYLDKAKSCVDYLSYELEGMLNKYFPVMKYKSSWRNRGIKEWISIHPNSINSIFKGYKYVNDIVPLDKNTLTRDNAEIDYLYCGDKYYHKLKKLCEKNGSELVLITVPHIKSWSKAKHKKIIEMIGSDEVKYIDFDLSISELIKDFDWNTDSEDGGSHLNYYGAKKTTSAIEKYLVDELRLKPTPLTKEQKDKWNNDAKIFYTYIEENA